ncbi:MAG: S9 family peptidase [Pyrinomonadaceae bacterium]
MKRILAVLFAAVVLSFSVVAQSYTIQQYLNIKSAGSPSFSPDGKQMIYLTSATGTSQIWLTSVSGGTPKQLTNYDDNIGFARWLPDGGGIVFGKARGGDENTQFFWMKPDGSGVKELTNDPKVRHNFAEVSKDGKKIYYASNKRNRTYFDVYSMELATGKEELLYQYDGNMSIAAVNDFGTQFVMSRAGVEKSLDNDLFLIDVRTKKEVHLTPHIDPSEFGNVAFLADSLLMTSNDKREFEALVQLRQKNASGDDWSETNRVAETVFTPNWDIGGVTMNDNSSMFAYSTNTEGFSDLYIRSIETGGKPLISRIALRSEKLPLPGKGVVGGMTFSNDGTKLAFSYSSPIQNGDIWIYDRNTMKLSQVTQSDRAGIDPKKFIAPELIKFKTFDGREIPAWYYKPEGMNAHANNLGSMASRSGLLEANTKIPVIVSVHGGPEGQSRPGFNALFQYYLSRGYAVLDPNVRGSTGYGKTYTHLDDVDKREDSVKDLAAAHEWLVKNGGADTKRVAVMGGSYGGYMTMAAVTLYPDLWAAAVNTVGIVNWETFLKNTSGYRRRAREVEYGMLDKDIEFLRRISPIRKIDRIKTPLFVIHGKNDPRVPYTEAEQVVAALKGRESIVEYKFYDDEGHGISKLKNRLELYPLVADFLDKYMK